MKDDYKINKVRERSKLGLRDGKGGGRKDARKPPEGPPASKKQENKKEGSADKSCNYCGKVGVHPPSSSPPRPKLPRLQTAISEVWQIQPLCFLLWSETKSTARET